MSDSAQRPPWVPENGGGAFTTSVLPGIAAAPRFGSAVVPARRMPEAGELVEGIFSGDRALVSRAITLVESNAPAHRPLAREILRRIGERPGFAHRIGISGVPGAGKSTFIEALGNHLCDAGHRVAVLAVDPSSSLSRGSILGDKTRMETLSRRAECFIRPSPSGGALGGVTRKTRETIAVCEAAGFDVVLIETVGVGQNEIAVRAMVDCFLLLLIAGAGDELQGMKKGIFEIADILLVNKADGENKTRAEATRLEFERVLHYLSPVTEGWKPPVLAASSITRAGIAEVWRTVEKYLAHVETTGAFEIRRREQSLAWWQALVEQELRLRFLSHPRVAELSDRLERDILAGRLAPSLAAEELLNSAAQLPL
ncbi:MAG: methylmalonyl Co-A mutase-associated GTPase MeaB [Chthoniobacterales bacterium]|nr:methylmalonyl Co-A mutase-associated GTPase MeaB [Chthoniobacterales bacterium]